MAILRQCLLYSRGMANIESATKALRCPHSVIAAFRYLTARRSETATQWARVTPDVIPWPFEVVPQKGLEPLTP